MKHFELLQKVRERISEPQKWTQRVTARSQDGIPVASVDANAVCWCVIGAFWAEAEGAQFQTDFQIAAFDYLEDVMGKDVARFNDSNSHQEVLAAVDKAILIAKEMNS